MILAVLIAPHIIQVSGLSSETPAAVWFAAMERVGAQVQGRIRYSYSRERARDDRRFKPNTPKWQRFKARKGFDSRRGHMKRRINRALGREAFFRVSAIKNGVATITFVEELLYQRQPHARHYARTKVPGQRILQINPGWLLRAMEPVRTVEARAVRARNIKQRAAARRIEFGPDQFSVRRMIHIAPEGAGAGFTRRPWTLAATATSVTAQTIAALRRI